MVTEKRPGAVKRAARRAEPYNRKLFALSMVSDGLVMAWICLDGHVNPAIYAAVTIALKSVNLAINYLSKNPGSDADGDESDHG